MRDKSILDIMVYRGDYFYVLKEELPTRKTPKYYIFNNNGVDILGEIKWFSSWRKFCFYPSEATIWDSKCLNDVMTLLDDFNKNWKTKNKK